MTAKEIDKDLKRLRLIPKTKAYKQQVILTKYMYVFMTGILFGALFI